MNRLKVKGERGFTLVEVIVVAVLLALMSVILFGTLRGIMQSQELISSGSVTQRSARAFFTRINQELMSKVSERLSDRSGSGTTTPTGGVVNPFNPQQSVMKGENGVKGDSDADTIQFVSDGTAQEVLGESGLKGRIEVGYSLVEPKTDSSDDASEVKSYTLVRSESPAGLPSKQDTELKTFIYPFLEDVVSLNFRYYKDKSWNEEWTNATGQFPEAIEITLQLKSPNDQIETFQTAIPLARKKSRAL